MWLPRSRGSHASPIEFVLKDRDCMVRVQRQWTKSDDERATLGQDAFFGRHEILVVREHEGGVRGETRLANVFAAFFGVDEYGAETIERLLEIGLRSEDTRRTLPFDSGDIHERPADECGIASDVGLVVPESEAFEAHEPRRVGRPEKEETDLDIPSKVMGEVEGGVRRVQQDVHAARSSRQVVQRKSRIRGGPMPDD